MSTIYEFVDDKLSWLREWASPWRPPIRAVYTRREVVLRVHE
jgi:hypothetical protein